MAWRIEFKEGVVADIRFDTDTNPVQTGKFANKAKVLIAEVVRRYLEQVGPRR